MVPLCDEEKYKKTHQEFSFWQNYSLEIIFCGNNNYDICLHLTNSWQSLTVNLS